MFGLSNLMGEPETPVGSLFAEMKLGSSVWKSKDAGISNIDVNMGVDGEASTCVISIKGNRKNVRGRKIEISSDFASIKIGVKLEVSLGYASKTSVGMTKKNVSTVFKGFISDVEVEVDYDGTVNVYITGMDGKMWLMASNLTKNFGEKKGYSDAVQKVYSENSSSFSGCSVDKTSKLSTPIYMCNESYYDFCMRAAKITGNYFFVYLGKFYFADLKKKKAVKKTIKPGKTVKRVRVRSSPFGIPKAVEVKSIDQKDASKVVKSKVSSVPGIGEGKDASGLTTSIKNTMTIYNETVKSVSEAKTLAESILAQRSINLVEAEIELDGDPSIALATGLKLTGFGKPIDNSYVVTNIQHLWSLKNSKYVTIVKLSANKYSPQSGGAVGSVTGLVSSFF